MDTKRKYYIGRAIVLTPPLLGLLATFVVLPLITVNHFGDSDALTRMFDMSVSVRSGYRGPFGGFFWIFLFSVIAYTFSLLIVLPSLVIIRRRRGGLTLKNFALINICTALIVALLPYLISWSVGKIGGSDFINMPVEAILYLLKYLVIIILYGLLSGIMMWWFSAQKKETGITKTSK